MDIKLGGQIITGQTTSVIVGSKVSLTSSALPTGASLSNSQWTIPPGTSSSPIATYTVVDSPASATVSSPQVTGTSADFYWVDSGQYTISYSVSVNGVPVSAQAIFNVLKPTATITQNVGDIAVGTLADGKLYLHLGNADTVPGVSFGYSISMPPGFAGGTFQWTQVVTSINATLTLNSGGQSVLQGTNVIDNAFQYPFVYSGVLEDSPDVELTSDLSHAAITASFESYLMYKPSGTDSIWVPLKDISWSWAASATRTGSPNSWTLDANNYSHSVGTAVNSTAEPLWSGSTSDLEFH